METTTITRKPSRRSNGRDARPNNKRRRALRIRLYSDQDGACPWCGDLLESPAAGELDRIIPGKKGGRYILDNLVLACSPCNQGHGHEVKAGIDQPRVRPAA